MDLPEETPFRIAFAIYWFVHLIVRTYFQMKARGPERAYARNKQRAALGFRVLAIAYVILIVYAVSPWFDFAHINLANWIRWVAGLGLLAFYLVFFSWTHIALGRHWSGLVEIHKDHALITTGPYRFIRHPMYSAFFLSAFGMYFLTANWLIFVIYFVAVASMYFTRVRSEEEMMIEQFGEAYREYMSRTGRLLPQGGSMKDSA